MTKEEGDSGGVWRLEKKKVVLIKFQFQTNIVRRRLWERYQKVLVLLFGVLRTRVMTDPVSEQLKL